VQTADDGCEIKGEEVQLKLHPIGLTKVPVSFFNAAEDAPEVLRSFILSRIEAVRESHRSTVRQIIDGANALLANYEKEQSREVMHAAAHRLELWLDNNADLSGAPAMHVEESLIATVRSAHPRTVFASVAREGEWYNLDYAHQLSHGARRIATQIAEPKLKGFQEIASNLLQDEELSEAHDLVQQTVRVFEGGFDQLVRKVQLVGQSIHADEMRPDSGFWHNCGQEWGRGGGYRDRINGHNQGWFLNKHGEADTRVISLIQENWNEAVTSVRHLLTPG
jgi:hypothetical protein